MQTKSHVFNCTVTYTLPCGVVQATLHTYNLILTHKPPLFSLLVSFQVIDIDMTLLNGGRNVLFQMPGRAGGSSPSTSRITACGS